jgi:hypothetical protein
MRQVAGAFAHYEKARLVQKLRGARDRASAAAGKRIEGAKPTLTGEALALIKRLHRKNPHNRRAPQSAHHRYCTRGCRKRPSAARRISSSPR